MHSQHYRVDDELNQQVYYINIHHNGDYSGLVKLEVRKVPIMVAPSIDSELLRYPHLDALYPSQTFEIPMEVVKDFMASYIRHKRIVQLEDASTDDILNS